MPDDLARDAGTAPDASERGIGSLFRTSGLIALLSLMGRLMGFAGDTVKSHYFGAGGLVDAFNVAAAVPTLLNDLLVQSLVNSAYIPIFSSYQATPGDLRRLLTALVNLTSLSFATVVLLVEMFAPTVVAFLNGSAAPDRQALTVSLLRITIPTLFVFNFSGIVSALLYAKQRLVLPNVAGMALNGTILMAAVLLQARYGIFALAVGLLLGALLQVAVLLHGIRGTEWPYRPLFWDPGLRRVAVLFSPILLGLLMEIFVSRPITFALASRTGEGGIAWMGYALTLRQAPEGLIAAALSITVLVRLSAVSGQNAEAFRATLAEGLRLAFLLIIPVSVGLFLLAYPTTALLFEHGSFTAFDTAVVAQGLRWYLLGLPFATVDLLLVTAFYARRNTRTPALIGVFTSIVYIGLSRALLPGMNLYGLMLADSVRFALHTALSAFFLFRPMDGLSQHGVYQTLGRAALATLVMGIVVGVLASIIPASNNLLGKALGMAIPGVAGLLVYVAALSVLGVPELQRFRRIMPILRRNRQSQRR